MSEQNLRALLKPASVAVIGATERPDASSHFVMRNLIDHGYPGQIYPVHPKADQVFGYHAYPSIEAIPATPDLAIVCIAARHVVATLHEIGRAGTQAVIVLSSGFAEAGPDGLARQRALQEVAAAYDLAICGPNCLGIVGMYQGAALYSSRFPRGLPTGPLALISQSGASAIALSGTGRIGCSYIISAGNSAVTDIPDYLNYLAADIETQVIALVLENLQQPEALARAIASVRAAGKAVILLYFGRTRGGARATAAHTGALTTSYQAVAAFCQRHGVTLVDSMDSLLACAELFAKIPARPEPTGIGLLGVSGGGIAHVTDFVSEAGLSLPSLTVATRQKLAALLPDFITPQNPLDSTGLPFADGDIYRQLLQILAEDPAIGLLLAVQDVPVGLDEGGAREYLPIADGLAAYAAQGAPPVVVVTNLGGGFHPLFKKRVHAAGIPLLQGTESAIAALKARFAPAPPPRRSAAPLAIQDKWQQRLETESAWTERMAKAWLADHGIRVPREILVHTSEHAANAAAEIGYPVVLKLESRTITHKSDIAGVQLNLQNNAQVIRAYEAILQGAEKAGVRDKVEGIVVCEMVASSLEIFVGISRHDPFGHGMVVGVGGRNVELFAAPCFALLPLDHTLAAEQLIDDHVARLLAGYRGQPAGDRAAFVQLLQQLSQLLTSYGDQIDTLELNPIAVLPPGQGVVALDALLLPTK